MKKVISGIFDFEDEPNAIDQDRPIDNTSVAQEPLEDEFDEDLAIPTPTRASLAMCAPASTLFKQVTTQNAKKSISPIPASTSLPQAINRPEDLDTTMNTEHHNLSSSVFNFSCSPPTHKTLARSHGIAELHKKQLSMSATNGMSLRKGSNLDK